MPQNIEHVVISELLPLTILCLIQSVGINEERATLDGFYLLTNVLKFWP
jgi:hypothetical protein